MRSVIAKIINDNRDEYDDDATWSKSFKGKYAGSDFMVEISAFEW